MYKQQYIITHKIENIQFSKKKPYDIRQAYTGI